MFRLIIGGSRSFKDYELLKKECDLFLQDVKEDKIVIITGGTRGADKLGEKYADEKGFWKRSFPINFEKFGDDATYIRNEEMVEEGDALIAFWDGKSSGTKNLIELAKEKGLQVKIVGF
ncbi:MAG: DUF2493 domain-containing protein [Syntrophomonadaceae bacterium]|nr:DUF2493 domain-containing protein [Syntrophomonadaceae bacterium]